MPNITVDGPAIKEIGKKRELVRNMTEAAAKAYGLPREAIIVVIRENSPENVGVGGELVIDRQKSSKGKPA
jgi:4-oxalocrotonate tautomerase